MGRDGGRATSPAVLSVPTTCRPGGQGRAGRAVILERSPDNLVAELVAVGAQDACGLVAISGGANPKAVQTMLGHQSAALTLDTYADLFPDDLELVSAALDQARQAALQATADQLRTGDRPDKVPSRHRPEWL